MSRASGLSDPGTYVERARVGRWIQFTAGTGIYLQRARLESFLEEGFRELRQTRVVEGGSGAAGGGLARIEKMVALQPPRPAPCARCPDGWAGAELRYAKYKHRDSPVLASLTRTAWADLHGFGPLYQDEPARLAALVEDDQAHVSAQADAFAAAVPQGRVVRIPHANHFVFWSNEGEVVK